MVGRRDSRLAPYRHYTREIRLRWLTAFVLLYIAPRRSLCPFVLKHRARRHATAAVRGLASRPLAVPPRAAWR